jgi:hypothetical protein
MTVVINFALFQLGWFACVLGAAHGLPWLGPLVAVAIIAWHLARARQAGPELVLAAGALLAGAIFDTLLFQTGWIHFSTGVLVAGTAPVWMMALWAIFATSLNVSLRWMRARPGLAVILGLLGGPLAYYSGARLGALTFTAVRPALAVIALGWAVLTPALLATARRFDGYAQP